VRELRGDIELPCGIAEITRRGDVFAVEHARRRVGDMSCMATAERRRVSHDTRVCNGLLDGQRSCCSVKSTAGWFNERSVATLVDAQDRQRQTRRDRARRSQRDVGREDRDAGADNEEKSE
jgi:hypothetical protein